jgi:membrane protease YdiL (CAAX protease family)
VKPGGTGASLARSDAGTELMSSRLGAFVRERPVICFFALAYALSWANWVPMALAGRHVGTTPGGPTHFLGLLGPMLAAFAIAAVAGGRSGIRELATRITRMPKRKVSVWLAIASPLLFFAVARFVAMLSGAPLPRARELGVFGGLPRLGPLGVWLAVTVWNGFGEEVGWRGFALPQLQWKSSPLGAAVLLGLGWAGWHLPLFVVIDTYRALGPMIVPGFVLGIVSGSIVLAWIYNRSGGSVLAVALWHGSYNFASGTAGARGLIAAVVSTAVMIWAIVLVVLDLYARRHHRPSVIGGRAR